MKFDVVIRHDSERVFPRVNLDNGNPAIDAEGIAVYRQGSKQAVCAQLASNQTSVYEVSIGDYIVTKASGTSCVDVYRITNISETVVTGSPC